MQSEHAYAMLQGITGESFFIQALPTRIYRRSKVYYKDDDAFKTPDVIVITDTESVTKCHCIINYDTELEQFYLIPLRNVTVNDIDYEAVSGNDSNFTGFGKPEKNLEKYSKHHELRDRSDFGFSMLGNQKIPLKNFSKIFFPSQKRELIPLVFYFVLPNKTNIVTSYDASRMSNCRTTTAKRSKIIDLPHTYRLALVPTVPDKQLTIKWTLDDREQLKKFLMTFGYGRWKEIQEASSHAGGRLKDKSILEVRLFANAFINCIIENLNYDNDDLREFLSSIIQEEADDPYIAPNSKDWDPNLIRQKVQPWGKRIQLLYRISSLINEFEEQQVKEENDQKEIKWETLLNFLPKSAFYGQRPSAWWTKKHDIDLLRGTYIYGYANYNQMRNHPGFSLKDLEQANSFVEFPSADAITRRLKKIVQTIARAEQNDGKIDFDAQDNAEKELETWTTEEKQMFYKFIAGYDVSLNGEGKPNWQDVKEKYQNFLGSCEFDKSLTDIEKVVTKIKIKCAQILNPNPDYMDIEDDELADLPISTQEAQSFTKKSNMLFFIRKYVLSNNCQAFKNAVYELNKRHEDLQKGDLGFLPEQYDPEKQDLGLLLYLSENGLSNLENLSNNAAFNFENYQLNTEQITSRLEFLSKKRKLERNTRDEGKKQKFQLNRDENGNIIFPLYIHSSLTLLSCGRISPNPNFHTEYNLFPVGYKSVRNYASMFYQGQRADYTCEILEGGDGRPIYRVTSSEDPENPIVRDSSTGCWVYVCSKVNERANIRKPKVTISGTERFGLLESNIVRILEHLPGAEACYKYKFKYRAQENVEARP